jgi:hypothetical protein
MQIRNGKQILETDDDYQHTLLGRDVFERDFFLKKTVIYEIVQITSGFTQYKLKTTRGHINLIYFNLKNSGTEDKYKKRLQVSKNIIYERQSGPYFAVGAYNAGDKIVYVVTDEISAFIKRAIEGKTYSSFWIEYPKMFEAYNRGYTDYIDNRLRRITLFTNEHLNNLTATEVYLKLFNSRLV